MRTTWHFIIGITVLITLSLCPWSALAEFPGEHPFPGITYKQETRQDPPMRLFVAEVDLTAPRLKIRVSPGGPDPDGPGEWETTLMVPTKVAARENFDLVVNGDFFTVRKPQESENQPSYRPDVWAGAVGPAATNGKAWSSTKEETPCLVVRKNGRVTIEMVTTPPADAENIIAGNTMLVEKGKPVPHQSKDKHPRTVVGLNEKNTRLVILVVDGRRKGISIGMSYAELAAEMIRLGCHTALNLDGGGSTVMAMRDPANEKYVILNTPSDVQGERAVANVLGISVAGEKKK